MNTEIINEINNINKQIQEINSKIEWNRVLIKEEEDKLSKLVSYENSLLEERKGLEMRIANINYMLEKMNKVTSVKIAPCERTKPSDWISLPVWSKLPEPYEGEVVTGHHDFCRGANCRQCSFGRPSKITGKITCKIADENLRGEEKKDEVDTVREYDRNGNLIYRKTPEGDEQWREYDSNGNTIHYRDSDGYEVWTEYDANSHKIHYKDNKGREKRWEYNSDGKLVHFKDSNGFEAWKEYNSDGRKIHERDTTGYEWFAKGYEVKKIVGEEKTNTGNYMALRMTQAQAF